MHTMDLNPLKIDRKPTAARPRPVSGAWFSRLLPMALLGLALWYFRRPLIELGDRWRLPRVRVLEVVESSALARTALSGTAANGYIVPRVRAALSADTPGRIVEMNVREGSVLKQGDVVARLYSEEYEALLQSAEAEVRAAHSSAARMQAEAQVSRQSVETQRGRLALAEAQRDVAQNDAELAERELARIQVLHEQKVASAQALDQAASALTRARKVLASEERAIEASAADLAQAQAALAAAKAAAEESLARIPVTEAGRDQAAATLAKTFVRAPFDGIVVLKDAEVGEVVSPNSLGGNSRGSVATMVDFASLEAQVELPETSIGAVQLGDTAAIFLDSFPTDRYEGRVDRIWPTANRQKATIEVRVVFEQPDARLRPEMGVRVVFSPAELATTSVDEQAGGIRIPSACVLRRGDERAVFLVEGGRLRWVSVELGPVEGGRISLRSGIRVGDKVVLEPQANLVDGDRVLVEE